LIRRTSSRVLVAVVAILEHHIFKGDAPRVAGAGIVGAGLEQFLQPNLRLIGTISSRTSLVTA
jgi:hypothetical protein